MSAESAEWLNNMTLQGFTDKRGTAWHYLESAQGVEPNHYPGAIPVADVKRRLFSWEPAEGKVKTTYRAGGRTLTVAVPTHKTWVHPETGDVLGVVGKRAISHGYTQWLLDNTSTILDDGEMGIGSAGLLKKGAVAWVQIELPDTVEGPGGIEHRPHFTATTVLDGSMSTRYQRGSTLVVCDNTWSAMLGERDAQVIKYAHRAGTDVKPQDVRDALGILQASSDAVNKELDELLCTPVSDKEWEKFVAAHLGKERPFEAGRGQTNWDKAHDGLTALYKNDPRCAPFTGTGFGVMQAISTFNQHERTVKGMSRPERNFMNRVSGATDKEDMATLDVLRSVLVAA